MSDLKTIKTEIDEYALNSKKAPLEIIKVLEKFYFNKAVSAEIKFYKNRTKKVTQITKELKISHRRFYKILDDKNIEYTKYKKSK